MKLIDLKKDMLNIELSYEEFWTISESLAASAYYYASIHEYMAGVSEDEIKLLNEEFSKNIDYYHEHSQILGNDVSHYFKAVRSGNLDFVTKHLDNNLNPNSVNIKGYTGLHIAASKNHVEVAQLLLAKGADTTLTDHKNKQTPLDIAKALNHFEMISLLENRK